MPADLQTRCSSPIFDSGCVGSRESARAASLCCRDRDPRRLLIASVPSRRPYRRFAAREAACTAARGQLSREVEHGAVTISSGYTACPISSRLQGLHPSRFEFCTISRFPQAREFEGFYFTFDDLPEHAARIQRPNLSQLAKNTAASSRKNELRLRNESPRTTWTI